MKKGWVLLGAVSLAAFGAAILAAQTPGSQSGPTIPVLYDVKWGDPNADLPEADADYKALYQQVPREAFPSLRERFNPYRKKPPFEFEKIDYPTGENNPTSYRFDMGPKDSPVEKGFTQVTKGDMFSWEKGWGWETPPADDFTYTGPENISPRKMADYHLVQLAGEEKAFLERGKKYWPTGTRFDYTDPLYQAFLDDLSRDAVLNPGELAFKVALPDGRYDVSMIIGDVQLPRYGMDVYANGYLVASDIYTQEMPFPRRVVFSVNVVRNNLRIALRANNTPFEERSQVAAEPPDYNFSQLPFVMAFHEKRWNPVFGKAMDLHGPVTQMAIASITIAPYQRPPLELIRQRLYPSPSVKDENALKGVEQFNAPDLAGAEASFSRIPDSQTMLKALAYLGLAGYLETDIEDELRYVEAAMDVLKKGLQADPNNVQADDLLRMLKVYRGGLAYFAELYKPSMKVTGLAKKGLQAQDSQARALHRRSNSALFTWVQPSDMLFSKALMRYGRYIGAGDPHRWTMAWQAAEDAFLKLQDREPGNRFSDYFLYWNTDGWNVKDYSKGTEGAPRWAVLVREGYGRMLDQAAWWGENRMQPDGSIGGGWGDDVEVGLCWLILTLINPDADPEATEAARAIAEGVWWSGQIDRDTGFYDGMADVEHSAEWSGDTQPYLIAIDYGNPLYFERNLKTAKLMRDLWMGVTPRGHLHFKSMMLGNKAIGAIGTSYGGVLDAEIDHPLEGRATGPAFWDWWYSPLDGLNDLFSRWAEAWYEDSMRAENGKPEGIIPGPVGFHTDVIGGNNATVWRQGAPQTNAYENPTYAGYVLALFSRMYSRTAQEKWLEPKAVKLTSADVLMDQFDTVPDLAKGSEVKDKYRLLDDIELPRLLDIMRKTWPSLTSENSNTDRIAVPGLDPMLHLLTGGDVEYGLDFIPMTLEKTSQEVAFMNLGSSQDYAKTIFYNFSEKPEPVALRLWRLQIGSENEVTVGVDENDDDQIDEVIQKIAFRQAHPGDSVQFVLPPKKPIVVEVKQTKPGTGMPKRVVDLALAAEDIKYEDGKLLITVHNIGNQDCGPFTMSVRQGEAKTGTLLGSFEFKGLAAPNDLEPRTVVQSVDYKLPAGATLEKPVKITVELDPQDKYYEITESNNVKSQVFPHEVKSYMAPRMWKTLAEQYGIQGGDPFPKDFPKDQIR